MAHRWQTVTFPQMADSRLSLVALPCPSLGSSPFALVGGQLVGHSRIWRNPPTTAARCDKLVSHPYGRMTAEGLSSPRPSPPDAIRLQQNPGSHDMASTARRDLIDESVVGSSTRRANERRRKACCRCRWTTISSCWTGRPESCEGAGRGHSWRVAGHSGATGPAGASLAGVHPGFPEPVQNGHRQRFQPGSARPTSGPTLASRLAPRGGRLGWSGGELVSAIGCVAAAAPTPECSSHVLQQRVLLSWESPLARGSRPAKAPLAAACHPLQPMRTTGCSPTRPKVCVWFFIATMPDVADNGLDRA